MRKIDWYFIVVDENLAGFVMVTNLPEVKDRNTDFQLAEFFVMHKYRRWQLKRHPKNIAAANFWDSVINTYTNGNYDVLNSTLKRNMIIIK